MSYDCMWQVEFRVSGSIKLTVKVCLILKFFPNTLILYLFQGFYMCFSIFLRSFKQNVGVSVNYAFSKENHRQVFKLLEQFFCFVSFSIFSFFVGACILQFLASFYYCCCCLCKFLCKFA